MAGGYLLKLRRAAHHVNDLVARTRDLFDPERYTVIEEPDPDGLYQLDYRVRIILESTEVPSDPFSLIIGDALYCLRSALDNLAYELNGAANPAASAFPIFGNETIGGNAVDGAKKFKGSFDAQTAGMSIDAKRVIELLQPYQRGNLYRDHPLWLLSKLCNLDKHREIPLVAATSGLAAIHVDHMENAMRPIRFETPMIALDKDTVVAKYSATPIDPTRPAKLNVKPLVDIGFADGPANGQSAALLLARIHSFIAHDVVGPLTDWKHDLGEPLMFGIASTAKRG